MKLGETDPELLRQLDEAMRTGEPVQAVVKLHRTPGKAPVPAVIEEQTRNAVSRTAETTGEQPTDIHVMGRLATAYISGSEKFLREFVEQPEVASAVANQVLSPPSAESSSSSAQPSRSSSAQPGRSSSVQPSRSSSAGNSPVLDPRLG